MIDIGSGDASAIRDAPADGEGLSGLQTDQRLAGPEGVGRAGHRLHRQAVTGNVAKRVAREEHEVGVSLVDPEGHAPALGIVELDASKAVVLALEVREAVVELGRADRSTTAIVELRALDGRAADGKAALVGPQHGRSGYAQDDRVVARSSGGQVG